MYPYIFQGSSLTIVIDGKPHTINREVHPNFDRVVDAIRSGDWEAVPALVDMTKAISNYAQGQLEVRDGDVYWDGRPFHNALTDRLLRMLEDDLPVEPLVNFLHNLKRNPSKRAVDELYGFLENNSLPITPDGKFLAYKKVRGDYKDIHSGTMDNSVGQVVSMPRNEVDEDRDRTCSSGLHFCSLEYLPAFGGYSNTRVMILEIDPADVVSIPSDYNNAKGRTCRYTVVGEHETPESYDEDYTEAFDSPVEDRYSHSTAPREVRRFTNVFGATEYRYNDGRYASAEAYRLYQDWLALRNDQML